MTQVLLVTRNQGKLAEARAIAAEFGYEVIGADDVGLPPVAETGTTYEENALAKARSGQGRLPALGEDSGLEVEALKGQPGVLSARYGGDIDQVERNRIILDKLSGHAVRDARFVAVCAIVMPDGSEFVVRGECPGSIADQPRGEAGFGYDPIFIPGGMSRTMGELSPDEKNRISHRRRALNQAFARIAETNSG